MKLLNRILTPILSLCSIPVLIFLPLFRIMISSGLSGTEGPKKNLLDTFGLSEFISIKDIYTAINSGASESGNIFKTIWDMMATDKKQEIIDMLPGLHWGIVFLVFLVIVVLFALVLAIVTAATKKPKVSALISAGGILSAVIMNASFNAFAKPFLNGAFNLNTILGNTNQLLGALLGNVASFDYMKLGVAYTIVLLIFAVTLILSISASVETSEGK